MLLQGQKSQLISLNAIKSTNWYAYEMTMFSIIYGTTSIAKQIVILNRALPLIPPSYVCSTNKKVEDPTMNPPKYSTYSEKVAPK